MIKSFLEQIWFVGDGLVHLIVNCALISWKLLIISSSIALCLHIFGAFFLNSSVRLNDVCISETFSLFKMVKFNNSKKGWNTLVHAILWSIWLNRNSIIFRQNGRNLFSILYQILHLTSS